MSELWLGDASGATLRMEVFDLDWWRLRLSGNVSVKRRVGKRNALVLTGY